MDNDIYQITDLDGVTHNIRNTTYNFKINGTKLEVTDSEGNVQSPDISSAINGQITIDENGIVTFQNYLASINDNGIVTI